MKVTAVVSEKRLTGSVSASLLFVPNLHSQINYERTKDKFWLLP